MSEAPDGLTAANWTLAGVATILTAGRYLIRWRIRNGFYLDDLCQLIALCALIAFSALMQRAIPIGYRIVAEQAAGQTPDATDVLNYRIYQNAFSNCFYVCIWFVKLTFMMFYRLLFDVSKGFMKAWWISLAILGITFWIPIAGNLTYCGPANEMYNTEACNTGIVLQRQTLIYICVIHVVTDFLVMFLPIFMLRTLHIRLVQKIGLGIIFSVVLVTIAMDILRTYETYAGGAFGPSYLYSMLEADLAVIAASVPTYRALFGMERKIPANGPYLDIGLEPTLASNRLATGRHQATEPSHHKDHRIVGKRDSFAQYTGKSDQILQSDLRASSSSVTDEEAAVELRALDPIHEAPP